MKPVLFTIGGVNFYAYGFFVAMAFFVTYLAFLYLARNKKVDDKLLFEKLLVVLVAGVVGARILYFILYYKEFSHWYDIFKIWQGGMVSFGGILGGLVALIIIFRKKLWESLDIFALSFLAGATVWRIGCFMAGDHPGVFSSAWYAINYQVPAVLFELAGSLIGFILFFTLYKFKVIKRDGYVFFLVWIWYGFTRLVVDQFRIDPMQWGLRTGQIAGIIMILMGIIGIIYLKFKLSYARSAQRDYGGQGGANGQRILKKTKNKVITGKNQT